MRAYPATSFISKPMLEVAGKPLIQRNVEVLRDSLGLRDIYIVIGYLGEQIKGCLGDGSKFGVNITYIQDNVMKGLAEGLYLVRDYVKGPFITILGDELYIGSNHKAIRAFNWNEFSAVCALKETNLPQEIKKNYGVEIEGDRILSLIEKPTTVTNKYLGCGTYIFSPLVFDYIRKTPPSPRTHRIELTDVINNLARQEKNVYAFFLEGDYINVNSVEDLNEANYRVRSKFFDRYKISLIIPAYNEEDSIGYVIEDFKKYVDEIIVVDAPSKDRTAQIAGDLGAKVVNQDGRGYGNAIKSGLEKAEGDIFIIVEADASFRAKDLPKILEYLKDADMVVGTRTTREMIEQGANMKSWLRWGNVFVGKLVEALWWERELRFTDVGCSYRGLWKDTYLKIRDRLKNWGPAFSPEMMIEVFRARKRIIEIPISYYPRIGGESKHSDSLWKVSKTALKMLKLIFKRRFRLE